MSPPASPSRRPGPVTRALTAPIPADAIEQRLRRQVGPALVLAAGSAIAMAVFGLAWAGWSWWSSRPPLLEPRHRPEALCFTLLQPPVFSPPVAIEPNVAMIRGRFPANSPPALALQTAMNFTDEMVVQSRHRRVGDFEVASLWLRLPEAGGSTHWLVLGWMEGSDLAICSFRFAGRGPVIGGDERVWGEWLQQRLLKPEYFHAGEIPRVRARLGSHTGLPRLGPAGS